MAKMSTIPVLHCPRCGRLMAAVEVQTYGDYSGETLQKIMSHLGEISYCKDCLAQRNYYIKIGRIEDWEAGRP